MKKADFIYGMEKRMKGINRNISVMIQGAITYRYNE